MRSNKDTRDFFDKAEKAGIIEELRKSEGATIFVTKGDIFGDTLSPTEKAYLLDHPQGRHDLARLLKHDISPKIYHSDKMAEGESTIETVEGGGMVVLLLKSMSSLKQLYTMTMVNHI